MGNVSRQDEKTYVSKWSEGRGAYVALDGLDRGVGGDLHVCWPEQRRAGVAARDGDDRGHHQVLDEGASNDDLDGVPLTLANQIDDLFGGLVGREGVLRVEGTRVDAYILVLPRNVGRVTEEVETGVIRGTLVRARHRTQAMHGRAERLRGGNVHVAVHLLVVDDNVHVLAGEVGLHFGFRRVAIFRRLGDRLRAERLGRGHAVELADLGGALQHLDRVGVCGRQTGLCESGHGL